MIFQKLPHFMTRDLFVHDIVHDCWEIRLRKVEEIMIQNKEIYGDGIMNNNSDSIS